MTKSLCMHYRRFGEISVGKSQNRKQSACNMALWPSILAEGVAVHYYWYRQDVFYMYME